MPTNDKDDWEASVEEKRKNMEKYDVWMPRKLQYLTPNAKIITSTWANKNKANGTYRARLNAIGYEQVEGLHYDVANIALLVTNNMNICIVMVLTLMAGWIENILDMKSGFLHDEFDE